MPDAEIRGKSRSYIVTVAGVQYGGRAWTWSSAVALARSAEAAARKRVRSCLCCRRAFRSAGERLCPKCRRAEG